MWPRTFFLAGKSPPRLGAQVVVAVVKEFLARAPEGPFRGLPCTQAGAALHVGVDSEVNPFKGVGGDEVDAIGKTGGDGEGRSDEEEVGKMRCACRGEAWEQ